MSILDHPLISERYFYPRRDPVDSPTWVDIEGGRLACYASPRTHPVSVVFFHGNGEVVADYVPGWVELFARLGADSFFAEYRGYGASDGVPKLGAMLDDVDAVIEAVGRPPEQIIVMGRSVGSIYAIEAAYRHPQVAGLVLESGIADPLERILMRATPEELETTPEALEQAFVARLDHAAKLSARTGPTLVMHARNDTLVDSTHAARLATWPAAHVNLVLFPWGDHNTVFSANQKRYMTELSRFIEIVSADDATPMVGRRQGPGQTMELDVLRPGRPGDED